MFSSVLVDPLNIELNITMKSKRKSNAIYWSEQPQYCITHEEMKELLDSLDPELETTYKSSIKYWVKRGTWRIEQKNNSIRVYVTEDIPIIYYTNAMDDNRNQTAQKLDCNPGSLAYKAVRDKFQEIYPEMTFKKAFDTSSSKDGDDGDTEPYKYCIPKQFYYINENLIGRKLIASAVDYCSQYPTNLCGKLPDGHKRLVLKGRHEPTAEYPFAFYLKSGCVAEYGKYDTHEWQLSRFKTSLFNEGRLGKVLTTKDEDETTVLMKASKYELTEVMKYFYAKRKTDETAKLVMNAFIGMLHTKSYNNHRYAHIVAIVIARANERMRALAEQIEDPIHICVDGCVYLGNEIYGGYEKALGKLEQEFVGCEFMMRGTNTYVAMKDSKVVKFKHGAYNARTDGKDIDICEGFDDMKTWIRIDPLKEVRNGKKGK